MIDWFNSGQSELFTRSVHRLTYTSLCTLSTKFCSLKQKLDEWGGDGCRLGEEGEVGSPGGYDTTSIYAYRVVVYRVIWCHIHRKWQVMNQY